MKGFERVGLIRVERPVNQIIQVDVAHHPRALLVVLVHIQRSINDVDGPRNVLIRTIAQPRIWSLTIHLVDSPCLTSQYLN